MKRSTLLSVAAGCLLSLTGTAQVQQYYRWINPSGYDHGSFNECLSQTLPTGALMHYACGSATNASGTPTVANLFGGTNTLAPGFSVMYNPPTGATSFVAVSMCNATAQSCFGILCNSTTPAGVTSMILLKTDYNGNYLNALDLGVGVGTSIAYDLANGDFAVLGNVGTGAGQNFEISSVDVATLAVNWDAQYDGCGRQDASGAIIVDGNSYVAVGTSTLVTTGARDIMVVKTTAAGVWTYTQIAGSATLNEVATDICLYTDAFGVAKYGIGGHIAGAAGSQLFCCSMNTAGGGYFYRYLSGITGLTNNTNGFAIAYSPNVRQLIVTGRHNGAANQNAIVMGFDNLAALNPQTLSLYDAPATTGNEELRDVTRWNSAVSPDLLYSGVQTITSLVGSGWPAQGYSWMMTSSSAGVGTCPTNPTYTTVTVTPVFTSCTAPTATTHNSTLLVTQFSSNIDRRDNCLVPFRMANSTATGYNVYPNPASDQLTIDANITDTDQTELQVFDMTGRVVLNEKLPIGSKQSQVSVKSLADGVYVYHLIVNSVVVKTEKLIISH